ncbi:MAG: hypothetical protein KC458_04895 [Dehalococcoidia bacterium]|nr:hypothetical protein [Dehalococcoidia bacterium]MCA9856597.1 hypothetical protein [Dehalococcoidia bacterium]MCB9482406.1 hypothetical protein [Dehalococcoidia bacterium]MCB9490741.1 hypothetical protein [Dehalococcoidia bacterium]
MADINVQRFYSEIVTRGRRNAPTYNEVRREAATMAERVTDPAALFRF